MTGISPATGEERGNEWMGCGWKEGAVCFFAVWGCVCGGLCVCVCVTAAVTRVPPHLSSTTAKMIHRPPRTRVYQHTHSNQSLYITSNTQTHTHTHTIARTLVFSIMPDAHIHFHWSTLYNPLLYTWGVFSAPVEWFAIFGLQPEASYCQAAVIKAALITCSIIIHSLNQTPPWKFNSAVMQTDVSMENAIHL